MSLKAELSDREKVISWVAHRTMNIEQNDIALIYGVNIGRVNEAIKALDYAVANIKDIYRMAREAEAEARGNSELKLDPNKPGGWPLSQ